jgi:hypothetical protein
MSLLTRAERVAIEIRNLPTGSAKRDRLRVAAGLQPSSRRSWPCALLRVGAVGRDLLFRGHDVLLTQPVSVGVPCLGLFLVSPANAFGPARRWRFACGDSVFSVVALLLRVSARLRICSNRLDDRFIFWLGRRLAPRQRPEFPPFRPVPRFRPAWQVWALPSARGAAQERPCM